MRIPLDRPRVRATPVHPYAWLWEPLLSRHDVELRRMFSGQSLYIAGRLSLHFVAKEDPWRGVMVCTEREHHAALLADFSDLRPHPILPKWLYLPESADAFEKVARQLVILAGARDPRFGIVSPAKKKSKSSRAARHGLDGHP